MAWLNYMNRDNSTIHGKKDSGSQAKNICYKLKKHVRERRFQEIILQSDEKPFFICVMEQNIDIFQSAHFFIQNACFYYYDIVLILCRPLFNWSTI